MDKKINKVFNEFWRDIVFHKNGKLNLSQIKKELFDYHTLLENVPSVYSYVSGGKLSKPFYDPFIIKAEHDDQIMLYCKEQKEEILDILKNMGANKEIIEVIEKY